MSATALRPPARWREDSSQRSRWRHPARRSKCRRNSNAQMAAPRQKHGSFSRAQSQRSYCLEERGNNAVLWIAPSVLLPESIVLREQNLPLRRVRPVTYRSPDCDACSSVFACEFPGRLLLRRCGMLMASPQTLLHCTVKRFDRNRHTICGRR